MRISTVRRVLLALAAVSCSAGSVPPSAPSAPVAKVAPAPQPKSEPSAEAPPAASQETPAAEPERPCAGSYLTLEQIWKDKRCHVATEPPPDEEPPHIDLVLRTAAEYVSGEPSLIRAVLANQSGREVDLVFYDFCTGLDPDQMFDLVVTNSKGEKATLGDRPGVGLFRSLDCKVPYVHATLPPGGIIATDLPFTVAANPQFSQPALRPGPLAPGTYTVEVTAPLARRPLLKESVSLSVRKR